MSLSPSRFCVPVLAALLFAVAGLPADVRGDEMAGGFAAPPPSARPWVYWFPLDGNLSREGITADLEAMQRVGIGGVLYMETAQGTPTGPVPFAGPKWRELIGHACTEAHRLGMEINMNDDAGWCGSGGPWITPELSMQKLTFADLSVSGPKSFDAVLPQPHAAHNFYRDVAVLAFPTPKAKFRIGNIQGKASYTVDHIAPLPAAFPAAPTDAVIARGKIVDLSAKMDAHGRLTWEVPAGDWTILRIGHTTTGQMNLPAPASGLGLECDKLSKAAIEAHFAGFLAKLVADNGPLVSKTLVRTHIDSWEVGSQNWTPRMREEFRRLRGYDPLLLLPVVTGRVVDSLEVSERFLWDLRLTVSDLIVNNYAGHMRELANQHGLQLSIEAYGEPADDIAYAGRADEPMGEFWQWGKFGAAESCTEMSSAAHVYGKRILGAESFTSTDEEKWLSHPGNIKDLGDWAFCEGINRFVFHRYAMQPWLNVRPGMSMGPWGLHYERTQTWWEQSRAWHQYLARCQFLLQQGLWVADICYLQPEGAPRAFAPPPHSGPPHTRPGYNFDGCTAEVVLTRMTVRDGRLVLPDGMSYRVLVLPDVETMTPELLAKVKELIAAGATVVAARPPQKSPSLADYPACDGQVKQLADELWKDGKITSGKSPEQALAAKGIKPDFAATGWLRYTHRRIGETDVYFVANPQPAALEAVATFRASDKQPELWWPESGRIEPVVMYRQHDGCTSLPLRLEQSGSVFVVFRPGAGRVDPIVALTRDGQPLAADPAGGGKILIGKATYGIPGDPQRTRNVAAKLQTLVDGGKTEFTVAELAQGDDPAQGIVKTLVVDFTSAGRPRQAVGRDPETMNLTAAAAPMSAADLHGGEGGVPMLEAWQPGRYEAKTAAGKSVSAAVGQLPPAMELAGPWEVTFPPQAGAPPKATFEKLISWSEHADARVKYFSGTATYQKTFDVPAERLGKDRRTYLDLGQVAVMAEVKLNGHDLGILWKASFRVDVSEAIQPGVNQLEVKVVNLWANRMIGDEQLPDDSPRADGRTLQQWPKWLLDGKPSPTGRYTFTSHRLWKKGDRLLPSGLLGPVKLEATQYVPLR